MVPEKTRNFIVGLTFLVALVVLAAGVLVLSKTPWLLTGQSPYPVKMVTDNANGVSVGAKVDLNGVIVGQVKSVGLVKDKESGKLQVNVVLGIDRGTDIPEGSTATISKTVTGTTSVSIVTPSASAGRMLPKDGEPGKITAAPSDAGGLIPRDIRDNLNSAAQQLIIVSRDLHVLLAYNTPEQVDAAATQPATQPGDRPVENISTLVVRLNHTMKSLDGLLTDPKLQSDVRQIVTNVREATETLNRALSNAEGVVKNADKAFTSMGNIAGSATETFKTTQQEVAKVSDKLVEMLSQIEKTTKEISEGGGTTGKLINDPRLYEGLLDLSKTLSATAKDLDFLLKKWKDEGVNFHMGK